ncbi:MAG: hypothetical protein RL318_990 [Fibrobacterota bacterium]
MNSKATVAALTMAIPLAAMAQTSVEEKQSKIEQALETALSRQGISIGGLATGEYSSSEMTGSAVNTKFRTTEPTAYTQVDFDLKARPNTTTTARAVFRMHLDWPNFWGSPSTPIETRWLSIDGKAMDMLYYSVGNMGLKWSPLTMWAPDVGFLYTPRLFAQQQQQAMNERFQGENKRILQGAQFGIRASVPEFAIDSFNVGVMGSKLYTADHSSAEALKAAYPFVWGSFDRILAGGRGDVTFLKGATLGATYLDQRDLKSTYRDQDTAKSGRWGRDSAQAGTVMAARLGLQADKFIEIGAIKVGLDAEYAMSSWNAWKFVDSAYVPNGAGTADSGFLKQYEIPKMDGKALSGALNLGYIDPGTVSAKLSLGYIKNDSGFRNDVAQSGTFRGGRILNTEQGWSTWNTFDAMYHNVYRFVPEQKTNQTAKNALEKNNYTNQVLDPSQAARAAYDLNVQMVLPNGQATANRGGLNVGAEVALFDGGLDIKGAFVSLSEDKATLGTDKAKYQKIQGGAKVRADKFLTGIWDLPLEFAGSFEQNTGKAGENFDYASSVINAGAYIAVHKRLALLAGFQSIDGDNKSKIEDKDMQLAASTGLVPLVADNKQSNLGLGLEIKIQEGAYLMGMWNKLSTKYTNLEKADFDQAITNVKLQIAF